MFLFFFFVPFHHIILNNDYLIRALVKNFHIFIKQHKQQQQKLKRINGVLLQFSSWSKKKENRGREKKQVCYWKYLQKVIFPDTFVLTLHSMAQHKNCWSSAEAQKMIYEKLLTQNVLYPCYRICNFRKLGNFDENSDLFVFPGVHCSQCFFFMFFYVCHFTKTKTQAY